MPRSENYSTDSVQSFKSNFREHLPVIWQRDEYSTLSCVLKNFLGCAMLNL
jgi:hypothetical protein